LPDARYFLEKIEPLYKELQWYGVYDLIEFLLNLNEQYKREQWKNQVNKILEKNNAAYRILNDIVQPISNKEAINAMEAGLKNSPTREIKEHLNKIRTSIILASNQLKLLKAAVEMSLTTIIFLAIM
jgi:hypothetical protein